MLVKRVDNLVRYDVVNIDCSVVKDIIEKSEEAISNMVGTGIYAFSTEIFSFVEPE